VLEVIAIDLNRENGRFCLFCLVTSNASA